MVLLTFYCSTLPILFKIILGSKSVPLQFVNNGEDALFDWNLNPRPDTLETVIVYKNRHRKLFAVSSTKITIFRRYENRTEIFYDVDRTRIRFVLKNTRRGDAGLYFANYNNYYYKSNGLIVLDKPTVPVIQQLNEAIENKSLILNCSTWSRSGDKFNTLTMKYNWTVNGKLATEDSGHLFRNSMLTVPLVSVLDQDKVINCFAYESDSAVSEPSAAYNIDVKHGPKEIQLVPSHTKYRLPEGSNLPSIYCVASCNPICGTVWQKVDGRVAIGVHNGSYLSLLNVSASDSGGYKCLAINTIAEIKSNTIGVLVSKKPGKPSLVEVTPPIKDLDLTLQCMQNSKETFSMYKITKFIWKTDRQNGKQKLRYIELGNAFKLTDVRIEDNGTRITCQTQTENWHLSDASIGYKVKVLHGPEKIQITPNDIFYARKSGDVIPDIFCGTYCNPQCNITWYKKGHPNIVVKSNVLSLGRLGVENGGNYYCEAANSIGNASSPMINVNVFDIRLTKRFSCRQNGNVKLTCSVSSSMKPQFLHWSHTKNNVLLRKIQGVINRSRSAVLIKHCNFQDDGDYTCRLAKTSKTYEDLFGETTTLTVTSLPTVISQHTSMNSSYGHIVLHFYSVPDPISSRWFRNDENLQNYRRFYHSLQETEKQVKIFEKLISIDCFVAKLIISNFTEEDAGDYRIETSNGVGVTNYTISLAPTGSATLMPLWLIASCSTGGIFSIAVIVVVFICMCKRKKIKSRNRKALETIRQRLEQIENDKRFRKGSDESTEDHYQFIGEEMDLNQLDEQDSLQSRVISYFEQSEIEEIISVSEISSFSAEDISSSYEDLKIVIHPSPYVNAAEETEENIIVVDRSDIESNLADDEISSSSSDIST